MSRSSPSPRVSKDFTKPGASFLKSKPSSGKVDLEVEPNSLEKDYIYNLQQQIYFLTLELKFLRERAKENKESDVDFKRDVSKQNADKQLRDQFAVLQGRYDVLQEELEGARHMIAQLDNERIEMVNNMESIRRIKVEDKSKLINELVMERKERERLEFQCRELRDHVKRLEDRNSELNNINVSTGITSKKQETALAEARIALETLTKESKRQAEELHLALVRAEQIESKLQRREELKITGDLTEKEERAMQAENARIGAENEQLRLTIRQLEEEREKIRKDTAEYVHRCRQLAIELENIRRDYNTLTNRKDTTVDNTVAERLVTEQKVKQLEIDLKITKDTLLLSSKAQNDMESRLQMSMQEAAALKEQVAKMDLSWGADLERMNSLEAKNMSLQKELLELQSSRETHDSESMAIRDRIERLQKANARLKVENERLRAKLELTNDLPALNDMTGLAETNRHVAQSLDRLLNKLQSRARATEDFHDGES
mmetsp:Transcript_17763/g.29207  ORF Transcript_17763/g.29207 Transcript_17763/m.29207 type:complete len:489 (-) Transcript_17763:219-1685(-)